MIKYWNRLIKMDNSRLTKKVFLWDKSLCKQNWSSEIKLLCQKVGLDDDFRRSLLIDIDLFIREMNNLLNVEWKNNLATKPKLRTYITIKENFITEDYVKFCLSRKKRSILAQFRLGILPIALETGRYKGVEVNERYCKFCPYEAVELENHVLCECSLYAEQRSILYNSVASQYENFKSLNNELKFIYLLKNEWKLTANFLTKAWSIRSEKIYSNTT